MAAAAPDPVAALVRARRASGSRPGARDDGCRLALCIEGGGMRGVVAGGMVSALEALGLVDCIDVVYGTSAGACAGAYMLAGQALQGTSIFYEDINNPTFLRIGRVLIRRPIMRVDYLIDHVMRRSRPLDTAAVLASPIPLVMMTTDVETGKAHALRDFPDGDSVLEGLRATTRLPLVAGMPVTWRDGRQLVDGALTEPIAVETAAVEGATHILVLTTRHDIGTVDGGKVRPWFARMLARHVSPAVADAYRARAAIYARLSVILASDHVPVAGAPYLTVVSPTGRWRKVSKIEKRSGKLVRGADAGWAAVMRWAGEEPSPYPDTPSRRLRKRGRPRRFRVIRRLRGLERRE
ncbi:patatin-like phospholipase family protein [Zavarzinia compransoris]|uniref:patatin-like phospholipase family protein n=1 Tax=Zavarzinia marina TaxID=2911065 RepID=UPI001F1CE9A0|nr:patatin-like phospholipase family protein [Zavarzinia marina]MCF4164201.1 patatin-like phospholipase family protein [Zavarzinia marina]